MTSDIDTALGLREPTVSEIIAATCQVFGVERRHLLSTRRARPIARPRQVAMHLSRTLTRGSLPQIAAVFGRDHTTLVHASKALPKALEREPGLREKMGQVEAVVLQTASRARPRPIETFDLSDMSSLICGLRQLSQDATNIANILQAKVASGSAVCGSSARPATTSEGGNAENPTIAH